MEYFTSRGNQNSAVLQHALNPRQASVTKYRVDRYSAINCILDHFPAWSPWSSILDSMTPSWTVFHGFAMMLPLVVLL